MIYKLIKDKNFIGREYLDIVIQEKSKEEIISIYQKMFETGYVLNFKKYGYEVPCCDENETIPS